MCHVDLATLGKPLEEGSLLSLLSRSRYYDRAAADSEERPCKIKFSQICYQIQVISGNQNFPVGGGGGHARLYSTIVA